MSGMKTAYLSLYNGALFIAWLYIFFGASAYRFGVHPSDITLDNVFLLLYAAQCAAVMEIVHALLGLTKTNVVVAVFQVVGRNLCLFGGLAPFQHLHDETIMLELTMAWALIEVVRFPMYLYASLGATPPALLSFIRYALPIVLYPIGWFCEARVLWAARQYYGLASQATTLIHGYLAVGTLGFLFVYWTAIQQFIGRVKGSSSKKSKSSKPVDSNKSKKTQ
jgi:very-long-chain (3R)-3-hydroxyacyl-CoA dehydratase